MAISLPVSCYIISSDSRRVTSINKDKFSVGGDAGNESSKAHFPATISTKIDIKYQGLSSADALTVETALKGTAGVTRISYNSKFFRILEGYQASYKNGLTNISFTMQEVG